MRNYVLILLALLHYCLCAIAQKNNASNRHTTQRNLTGKIIDEHGLPLGAGIVVKNTNTGAATSAHETFKLFVRKGDVPEVPMVGFIPRAVTPGVPDTILMALPEPVVNINTARDYVNQVRSKAGHTSGWVKNEDDTTAANTKTTMYITPWTDVTLARKAVHFERALALAMDGHRFFYLVRYELAGTEKNAYFQKEKNSRTYLNNAVFTKNTNESFPTPQTQVDLSAGTNGIHKMNQNPGY